MRILLLVDCYLPDTKSSAKLIHDLAVEFHRLHHDVIVAAPDNALSEPIQITNDEGITVLRIRTGQIKGATKVIRAINEARLSQVIWKAGRHFFKANPCDLIVFYSPSIFFGSLVQKLKSLWNCKTYLVLRDIFPQWAVDTGVLKEGPVCWFFRHKERQQYRAADVIGVQSPANLQYFSQHGLQDGYNLEVLYNWATLNENKIDLLNDRKRLGLEDKVVFFYGGNIGVAQELNNIIRLADSVRGRPDIHFLLVGDGSEVPHLKAKIHQSALDNISVHSPVTQQQYLGMLSQYDVGLISLNRNLKTHNYPGKMLGYMYFSMPILANINIGNDLKDILEESRAGFVCISGEQNKLREYALKLAEDKQLRRQMGKNARALLEETFCVSCAASQILSNM